MCQHLSKRSIKTTTVDYSTVLFEIITIFWDVQQTQLPCSIDVDMSTPFAFLQSLGFLHTSENLGRCIVFVIKWKIGKNFILENLEETSNKNNV